MYLNRFIYNYFLILFVLIPVSLIVGSAAALVNILMIDISFIALIFFKKNFRFLKNKTIIYLLILYLYLFLNTLISLDYTQGISRNLGFLRMIILFLAFNYFFYQKLFFDKMIKYWLIIFLIVVIDVFIEYSFGKNILGYGKELYGNRIVSFFKDEPIVGGYINGFFLIIIGFFLNKDSKYNYFFIILSIIFLTAIILTGERSNSIKAVLGLSVLLILYKNIKFKYKVVFFSSISLIFLFLLMNSSFLKLRYIHQIKTSLGNESIYLKLYQSGLQVFKNNIVFGVGNKNYRVETCNQNDEQSSKNVDKYICTTHPHQIYFDFLSEHGLFGTFIIMFIFYKLIFSKIKETCIKKNYLQLGALIYLIIVFTPIIPSGAFFNNYTLTIFIINLSIFYATGSNINLFKSNN